MNTKAVWTLIFVIVVVLLYQFVIRPMQMDKKLSECLYGRGVTWVTNDEQLAAYKADCYRQYGR